MKVHELATGDVEGSRGVPAREGSSPVVLAVVGEMDAKDAPALRSRLDEAARTSPGRPVVLDLSQAPFIDSTCLGALVRGHKAIRLAGGTLSVVVPPGAVRRVLEVSGMDHVLALDETLDAALRRVPATER